VFNELMGKILLKGQATFSKMPSMYKLKFSLHCPPPIS